MRKIPYSHRHLISRWYATSTESLAVVPYDYETTENDSKPLTAKVTDEASLVEEEEIVVLRGIVEKFVRDSIKASQESGDVKLLVIKKIEIINVKLLVIVGKVLFFGEPSACLDSIIKASASEGVEFNKEAHKTFYSRVSEEYIREVEQLLVDKCGFKSIGAKQRYHIKVRDNHHKDLIISCKCKASHDSALELCKVEHSPFRHMVTDVSCLSKNFDLRIMFSTKRVLKNLDADVADGNELISAAVINPEAKEKGGLSWPLGKESVTGRFVIVGVWHTEHTILSRDKIRVDLRQTGRFDFTKSIAEYVSDVSLKLRGLSELLTEDHLRDDSIVVMIQEVIDLIWDNPLSLSACTLLMSRRQ